MAQIFPRWTNDLPRLLLIGGLLFGGFGAFAAYYWLSPWNTDVGYAPKQPLPYSHKLHAGDLGLDCRYCHAYAERGPFAGVPPTEVCLNCHRQVKKDSPLLAAIRESAEKGAPVPWKRIHKLPDFAYFDHSAHLGVGVGENRASVGCESCHGRIDTMEVVRQSKPLSMSWCLECHNQPERFIRPVENITTMGWLPDPAWKDKAETIAATLHPPGSLSRAQQVEQDGKVVTIASAGCSGCHR